MYVHTRERDNRPGIDGVKIKLLLLLYIYGANSKINKGLYVMLFKIVMLATYI